MHTHILQLSFDLVFDFLKLCNMSMYAQSERSQVYKPPKKYFDKRGKDNDNYIKSQAVPEKLPIETYGVLVFGCFNSKIHLLRFLLN